MQTYKVRQIPGKTFFLLFALLSMLVVSCRDHDWETTPDWLGESIYDELSRQGNFSIYLHIVDDLGQKDFLQKTGSVTVFVADDDAYRAWFQAHGTDENHLSIDMKKWLFNSSMLNNAYVLDMLTNAPGTDDVTKGQVMRRTNTAWTVYDSIPAVAAASLPEGHLDADYWKTLREQGGTVNLIDNGTHPMVHFLSRQMSTKGVTAKDFAYLFNGQEFNDDDVYINNVKVREGNITCQNGYLNIMDGVVEPLPDMAAYIKDNGKTNLFSEILDRFSAPASATSTAESYKSLRDQYASTGFYPTLAGGDSIYERHYFWQDPNGNGYTLFNGTPVNETLKFDPAQHDYIEGGGSDPGADMGAIFAPTDEAMREYWNSDGGSFLRTRYPGEPFENVPDNVLAEFLGNHMQYSFLSSVPSKFNNVLNDAKDPIGLNADDIDETATCVCDNGAVYVMNKVYAPATFRSVFAPTLVNDNMRIWRWVINNLEFKPYLLSMISYYNFLILTDDALSHYVDPVTYNTSDPRWFEFYFDGRSGTPQARTYKYDKKSSNPFTHDDMRTLYSTLNNGVYSVNSIVSNRLSDLMNYCIIPRSTQGDNVVKNGVSYLINKNNGIVHVQGQGAGIRIENQASGEMEPVTESVDVTESEGNGIYYVLDNMVQPTMRSLLDELGSHPEYSTFYELLLGNPEWTANESNIYALMKKGTGMSINDDNTTVKSFNSFQYTVYVPDNNAMQKAIDHGLPTWDRINALDQTYAGTDVNVDSLKEDYTQKLLNFLKYHFQDYSVFVGGDAKSGNYETAAQHLSGAQIRQSYTVSINAGQNGITVSGQYQPSWADNARVVTSDTGKYNQLVREYQFSEKNNNGIISTSSWAVVHHISEPLLYSSECLCMKTSENQSKNRIWKR